MKRMLKSALLALLLAAATKGEAALFINEIMPANGSAFMDSTYNFGGWIEIYNSAYAEVSLNGYSLSVDAQGERRHRINAAVSVPARGRCVIFFGHSDMSSLQIDDKLDCEAGTVTLFNRLGNAVDQVSYGEQIFNTSYARTKDGGSEWGICTKPTPWLDNRRGTFATGRCDAPQFITPGGLYSGSVTVEIESPQGKEVHYTLDGTEPTPQSPVWTGAQSFSKTAVIRAQIFDEGMIPSPVVSRSYIITDHRFTLPVVSIVTDPRYLFNDTVGIYVKGTNGITGNGQSSPCNFNQDWSRPANIEYYVAGEQVLDQMCDITIGGGWTRASAVKSLKLEADKKYEMQNTFDYEFFAQKPGRRFKGIYLRNGGNDNGGSMMKDAFQHCLAWGALDVECQAYQPVVHFINGQFYGIINLRERSNVKYVDSNFGYSKEEIDFVEKIAPSIYPYFEVKSGSIDAMDELIKLSRNASDEGVYRQIEELMDVDNFICYFIPELFSGNWDWPENNVKFFRLRQGGRFRWIIYDLENGWSSGFDSFADGSHGITGYQNTGGNAAYSHTATLFRNLTANERFRNRFIDYMSLALGSVYAQERIVATIDSIADLLRPEMSYHQQTMNSCWWFEGYVSGFRNEMAARPQTVMQQMKSFFALPGDIVRLSLKSNRPGATLYANEVPVPLGSTDGYTYTGRSLALKAVAPAGYRFAGWADMGSGHRETVLASGSTWKYYDKGSLDGKSWYTRLYSESGWSEGAAPLGYGKGSIATTISYGSNSSNKRPTAYFRTSFNIKEASELDSYRATLTVDDGAIVYLNGTEVYRHLLPDGEISYNTLATTYAPGNPDVVEFDLPASLVRNGSNQLAVCLHQNSTSSTDLYLDLSLVRTVIEETATVSEPQFTRTVEGDVVLCACFEPVDTLPQGMAQLPPLRINEVSASNDIYCSEYYKRSDWIELYNTTDTPQPLAGLYITNDPSQPQLYCLPCEPGTVVPPYGHAILWADKKENVSQQHLPFKLPAEGGRLMLSAYDGERRLWCDSLTYVPHSSDHTFGRYPDGSDSVYLFNRTSYMAANIYSPCNINAEPLVLAFNDSIENTHGDDTFVESVTAPARQIVAVAYYSIGGTPVGSRRPTQPGAYIRREQYSDGSCTHKKILVR